MRTVEPFYVVLSWFVLAAAVGAAVLAHSALTLWRLGFADAAAVFGR